MLALRVPGGFSSKPAGGASGVSQVCALAFLMQIIGIRDIYPSKTNGKQQVAKNHPHKTQCFRNSTLAKHSVLEAPMLKTHSKISTFAFQDDPMPHLPPSLLWDSKALSYLKILRRLHPIIIMLLFS